MCTRACLVFFCAYSANFVIFAHDYPLESRLAAREPEATSRQATFHMEQNPISQKFVPTLSYTYEHPKRHSPKADPAADKRADFRPPPQGSYYSAMPVNRVRDGAHKLSAIDSIASVERRERMPTTGVVRTYGRGQATISSYGGMVNVPNTANHRIHKATVSTRVFDLPHSHDLHANEVISRSRRNCAACPKDEIVYATKGHTFIVMPHPCTHRWQSRAGPKPGTRIGEGVHYVTGTIKDHQKRFCQYRYEVRVRRCPNLIGNQMEVTCTADNAWGSKCHFTCPSRKILIGSETTECNSNMEWSSPEPICVADNRCSIPSIENGTKLKCDTNEITDDNDGYLPDGTHCRLRVQGIEATIRCHRGHWKKTMHGKRRKGGRGRRSKKGLPKVPSGVKNYHCEPNPCLNGGQCLFSPIGAHSTHVCVCPPNADGPRCEFTECDRNPCQNNGRCLQVKDEKNCFCPPNFTGHYCEEIMQ